MDKKKIEIIITSVLICILIVGLLKLIPAKRVQNMPFTDDVEDESFVLENSTLKTQEKLAHIEIEASRIDWRRNPFIRGRVSGSSTATSLDLSGIMWDAQTPTAIVGNEVVMEGDVIGKYTVIKINKNNVIISSDEGQKTLSVWQQ